MGNVVPLNATLSPPLHSPAHVKQMLCYSIKQETRCNMRPSTCSAYLKDTAWSPRHSDGYGGKYNTAIRFLLDHVTHHLLCGEGAERQRLHRKHPDPRSQRAENLKVSSEFKVLNLNITITLCCVPLYSEVGKKTSDSGKCNDTFIQVGISNR